MYNLQIYKLPKNNNLDIFTQNTNININSPFQNHQLFTLGYHHFIERTRNSLSQRVDNFETKKEFYYIVNNFETTIPNYENDIYNLSKIYFKEEIISREFYKFWEICFLFDIFDDNNLNIMSLNDNGELQAIKAYREKFVEKNKKDKYYNKYKKDTLVDLIISNENINTENDFVLILIQQLIYILSCQKKNGNLVLKIGDTFTMPTIKIIYMLTTLYDECYIYKPFFSRPSDNEKYIICKKFEGKNTDKIISNLEKIYKSIDKNYITDIFLDLNLDTMDKIFQIFKFINIKLINYQQIIINDIIKYIKDNNYFGDKYHKYRNDQIEATTWWNSNFFPNSASLYKSNKDNLNKLLKTTTDKNNLEKDKFIGQLL